MDETIIKDSGGAYTTNTVRGYRASSTGSAEIAAVRLARKLLGDAYGGVQQVIDTNLPTTATRWKLLNKLEQNRADEDVRIFSRKPLQEA